MSETKNFKYKPLQDHVIVEILPAWSEEEKTESGLVLLPGQKNISQDLAIVKEVGPGLMTPQGLVEMTVKVGDIICLHPMTIMKSFVLGELITYTKASNVLFIVENAQEAVKELLEKNKDKIEFGD